MKNCPQGCVCSNSAGWSLVVAALVAFSAGGITYAASPDSSGTIHACYGVKDGILRIIDPAAGESCDAKKENPLSWNQEGATGPIGPGGPTGPAGPSNAYTNYGSSLQRLDPGNTQTVASVTLPTGDYTLAGTVLGIRVGDSADVVCFFISFATVHGTTTHLQLREAAIHKLPLIGDVTIATDNTTVFLRCQAEVGSADVVGEMIATHVGAITPSL